jgi:hypothetical protein
MQQTFADGSPTGGTALDEIARTVQNQADDNNAAAAGWHAKTIDVGTLKDVLGGAIDAVGHAASTIDPYCSIFHMCDLTTGTDKINRALGVDHHSIAFGMGSLGIGFAAPSEAKLAEGSIDALRAWRAERATSASAAKDGLGADFDAPDVFLNRHGQVTNGTYTLDESGMAPHMTGSGSSGKSQFLSGVDADSATLDAAAYADKNGLWSGNSAKVYVKNGPVGIVGRTGQLTNWINIYRTNTGFVHGAPGNTP